MKTVFILFFTVIFIMLSTSLNLYLKYLLTLGNLSWNLDFFQYTLAIMISLCLSYIIWKLSKPEIIRIIHTTNLENQGLKNNNYNYVVNPKTNKSSESVIKKQAKDFFKVAGSNYNNRQDIIKEFAKKNTQIIYDGFSDDEIAYTSEEIQEFFVYEFDKVKLMPDKFHPLDKYAIEVHLEGHGMVGFVPQEINKQIYNLLKDCKNYNTEIRITGGNYKFFNYEDDKVDIKKSNYGAEIYINFHIEL